MEKDFRKIKIADEICRRLIEKKGEDQFRGSLESYIEQILDLVSRK